MKSYNSSKYYAQIDGLRVVALTIVIFLHYFAMIEKNPASGYFAIDIFLVISGFLITKILIKQNGKSFGLNYKNFIGRRVLRIFPIYYLTIAVLWLANLDMVRNHLLLFVTYTFNYGWIKYNLPFSPVTHFWSLCVEEQFYLFWPILALLLKNRIKLLTIVTVLLILIGYAQILFNIFPDISAYNAVSLLTKMTALGLGALAAILSVRKLLPARIMNNLAVEVIMLVALALAIITNFADQEIIFGPCAFYLVLKAAFYGFKLKPINTFLTNPIVNKISVRSYGIYTYHLPVAYYFNKCLFEPTWHKIDFTVLGRLKSIQYHAWIIGIPIQTALTIAIAWLSFKYFETPILKLKNKYFI